MKAIGWIIGGIAAIAVFFFVSKRKANAAAIVSDDVVTQGQTLAPIPGPSAPSASLCQAGVTVGGALVGAYYGVPPQVTLPAGAAASGPICSMGKKLANKAIADTKATVQTVAKAGAIVAVSNANIAKDTLKLAGKVTDPKAFVKGSLELSKRTVTQPIKTTVAVGSTLVAGAKKLNPLNW